MKWAAARHEVADPRGAAVHETSTKKAANHDGEWLETATATLREAMRESGVTLDFAMREQLALGLGNEIVRRALERELQEQADAEPTEVVVGGETYRRHQRGRVPYHSLVGSLCVSRRSCRMCSQRNGPTVVPLELTSMLVSRATPAMSYVVAHASSRHRKGSSAGEPITNVPAGTRHFRSRHRGANPPASPASLATTTRPHPLRSRRVTGGPARQALRDRPCRGSTRARRCQGWHSE